MASNNSRSKNTVLNMTSSIILQLVTAISGLILPKLIIDNYGSDANGLIASITQFLSYISLLEAGAEGVIRAALYKPLAERDLEKVSGIVVAARRFFSKIGCIFLIYIVGLCFIYPHLVKTAFDYKYIILMILILSIGTIMQYFVGLHYSTLIAADQRSRIISLVSIAALVANVCLTYLLVFLGMSLHIVKLVSCLVFAAKPICMMVYVKKHYALNLQTKPDNKAISQRWNGLLHHLAYFIHTNTDVTIISFFMSTAYVSVYTLYYAVVIGIEKIVTSISSGSSASFGNLIASENINYTNKVFAQFEFIQSSVTTVLFTVTGIMIVPFIKLYTVNVTDINYIYPFFAFVLTVSEALYCIRCIYSTLYLACGRYRETQFNAMSEAVMNVLVSVVLIQKFGLIGIAFGTLIGMFTRLTLDIRYASRYVLNRPIYKAVKNIGVCFLISAIAVGICWKCFPPINSWVGWILYATASGIVTVVVAICIHSIFSRDIMISVLKKYIPTKRRS